MEKYYRKPVKLSKKNNEKFQCIEWFKSDEMEQNYKGVEVDMFFLRVFGVNTEGQSVCCTVCNYNPSFYIKIPDKWNLGNVENFLENLQINKHSREGLVVEDIKILRKKEFFGYTAEKEFKFAKLKFFSEKAMKNYIYILKKNTSLPVKLYETNMDALLKFLHSSNIQPSNWVKVDTFTIESENFSTSSCQINIRCDWKDIHPTDCPGNANLLQASYDIETYSCPITSENGLEYYPFPVPEKKGNVVYQIATCFKRLNEPDFLVKHILTLKKCAEIEDPQVVVWECENEKQLLLNWKRLINLMDPDILYQYNGDMFDCNYMCKRAEMLGILPEFYEISRFLIDDRTYNGGNIYQAELKESTFSSSAYGTSEYRRLVIPGRLNFDILIFIKREFKENSYKLDNISEKYLGEKKNDVTVSEIFRAYETGDPEQIKKISEYCFCEGTRVSLPSCSVDIKCLEKMDTQVITWVEDKGFSTSDKINFFDNGKRDCIQLTLIDGTKINCTKDHKFLTKTGWIEAQDLEPTDKIIQYPEPAFVDYEKEKFYTFVFSDLIGELKYEEACIFSRILGYLLTDGCISNSVCYKNYSSRMKYNYARCTIHLGTKIDAENMKRDIFTLTGKNVSIRKVKYTFVITLPTSLTKWYLSLGGVEVGRRLDSSIGMPDFIIDDNCPDWISREFLKGLMGGDGGCPCLSTSDKLSNITFFQSKTFEFLEQLKKYMETIQKILKKFNIKSNIRKENKNDSGNGYTMILMIAQEHIVDYYEKIGYAYCIGKTYKLAVASSYYRLRIETKRQHNSVCERFAELKRNMSNKKAMEQAHKELVENEAIFNHHYSLPSDIYSMKPNYSSHFKFSKKHFPGIQEYMKLTETYEKFTTTDNKKSHAVRSDEEYTPCFYLSVIHKKDIGQKNVYDIEVKNTHNFVANGSVVHNCIVDTLLPQKLVDKLKILQTQISMSNVTLVPIKYLIERGQQVKALSQIAKNAKGKGFLMPHLEYKTGGEPFKGAHVFEPEKGAYFTAVTVLDFASLYPSIIRAHNLCFSSIVMDPKYDNLPDVDYLRVRIDDREHVFVQNTTTVLPDLLADLAVQRKKYKKLMEKEEDPVIKEIYNKTQLAYKISMNSIYGILGSGMGHTPIAASVTQIGREMLEKTRDYIEQNHHCVYPVNKETRDLQHDETVTVKVDGVEKEVAVADLQNMSFPIQILTTAGYRSLTSVSPI